MLNIVMRLFSAINEVIQATCYFMLIRTTTYILLHSTNVVTKFLHE